jgi:hypothetical protein
MASLATDVCVGTIQHETGAEVVKILFSAKRNKRQQDTKKQ